MTYDGTDGFNAPWNANGAWGGLDTLTWDEVERVERDGPNHGESSAGLPGEQGRLGEGPIPAGTAPVHYPGGSFANWMKMLEWNRDHMDQTEPSVNIHPQHPASATSVGGGFDRPGDKQRWQGPSGFFFHIGKDKATEEQVLAKIGREYGQRGR